MDTQCHHSTICCSLSLRLSQHFKVLVEELHVKGEAKIKNAMKEAFKILNEVCVPQCPSGVKGQLPTYRKVALSVYE